MFHLLDPSPRRCDGMNRRSFLQAGTLGIAGASLSLADLLRAGARATEAGRSGPSDRSVILIWLDGGPPQHETYDPKPEAPAEFRGPFKADEHEGSRSSSLRAPAASCRLDGQDVDHPVDASR